MITKCMLSKKCCWISPLSTCISWLLKRNVTDKYFSGDLINNTSVKYTSFVNTLTLTNMRFDIDSKFFYVWTFACNLVKETELVFCSKQAKTKNTCIKMNNVIFFSKWPKDIYKTKTGGIHKHDTMVIIHVVLNDIMTPYYSHMKINIYTNRKIGDQMTTQHS